MPVNWPPRALRIALTFFACRLLAVESGLRVRAVQNRALSADNTLFLEAGKPGPEFEVVVKNDEMTLTVLRLFMAVLAGKIRPTSRQRAFWRTEKLPRAAFAESAPGLCCDVEAPDSIPLSTALVLSRCIGKLDARLSKKPSRWIRPLTHLMSAIPGHGKCRAATVP